MTRWQRGLAAWGLGFVAVVGGAELMGAPRLGLLLGIMVGFGGAVVYGGYLARGGYE